ncbi:AAA family ATPase [Bifidobacterium catulorum]|uniref:Protein CR006 P-loop domain-containing protein n=1 Tax=Bifidobacterium catulorum TaxID=1630173 RepID=A0A2U2MPZ2_9BIFI|nr:AAA family ATPase [Bifidobacterium catulorum]PWG58917.1 hypothetical protein DF200_10335 [Bifidobacterium catulorum]
MCELRKFTEIVNFGVFRSFHWSQNIPEFKQINIIYGWNGTGKSTFMRLLESLESGVSADFPEGCYVAENENEEIFTQGQEFSTGIRVFNEDFIKRNVNFEQSTSQDISVTFGEKAIALAMEIEQYTEVYDELKEKYDKLQEEKDRTGKELSELFSQTAKTIGIAIEGAPSRKYTRTQAKADFELLVGKRVLLPAEYNAYRQTLSQKPLKRLEKLDLSRMGVYLNGIVDRASDLLCQSVRHVPINELTQNTALALWVEKGLQLHETLRSRNCAFCENPISDTRMRALKNHFNEDDKRLKASLDECINGLRSCRNELHSISCADEMRIYDELRPDYLACKAVVDRQLKILSSAINDYISVLNAKKQKPDRAPIAENIPSAETLIRACDRMNFVIDRHNRKTDSFDKAQSLAKKCLKEHELSLIAEKVDAYHTLIRQCEQRLIAIRGNAGDWSENTLSGLSNILGAKKNELAKNSGACPILNRNLATFLGRTEIEFQPRPDEGGYSIVRDGHAATHLSEGERLAIAFVFFVTTLEEENFTLADSILAIDDPVSSLDANYRYQAFSFLKEVVEKSKQAFITTHDFSFLKILLNWAKHARGKKASFYMLQCSNDAQKRRCSSLAPLDNDLNRFETEYRFLFHLLKTYENDGTIRSAYPIPNIVRKVLDTFLMNNVPICGSPYQRLGKIDFDERKKASLYKFANDESHITGDALDPALVPQTRECLGYLFEMMHAVAPKQYEYLCEE